MHCSSQSIRANFYFCKGIRVQWISAATSLRRLAFSASISSTRTIGWTAPGSAWTAPTFSAQTRESPCDKRTVSAPSHASASTREFIRLNKPNNEELLAVPPSSPDLNMCDYYLWKAIQDRLQRRHGTRVWSSERTSCARPMTYHSMRSGVPSALGRRGC